MGEDAADGAGGGVQAPVEFVAEDGVGELGLVVAVHGGVGAFAGGVVEGDSGPAVVEGGDGDHPRVPPLGEAVEQQRGEGEVAEVVGGELQFVAVGGEGTGRGHHARGVDQHVGAYAVVLQPSGERADGGEVAQVQVPYVQSGAGVGGLYPSGRGAAVRTAPGGPGSAST